MADPPVTFQLPADEPALLFSGYSPFPVTDVNDLWLQASGFSRKEVIGQTMRIIQGPETERDIVDELMTHIRRCQPFSTVLTNYTKLRQPFRNELHVEPVDAWNGLRGPYFLARFHISLLTKQLPKLVTTGVSFLVAQPQSTIRAAADKCRPIYRSTEVYPHETKCANTLAFGRSFFPAENDRAERAQ